MSIVEEFGNENFIICGDFNLVLCPELDYCNIQIVFVILGGKQIHLDRLDWIFSFLQKVCLLI
jgi:hypothetical protein